MASLAPSSGANAFWGTALSVGGLLLLFSTTAYSAYELRTYENEVEKLQSLVRAKTVEQSSAPSVDSVSNTVSNSDSAALQKQIDGLNHDLAERSRELEDANSRAQTAATQRDLHIKEFSDAQAEILKLQGAIKALEDKLQRCIIVN